MGRMHCMLLLALIAVFTGCLRGGSEEIQFTLTVVVEGEGDVDPGVGDHQYPRHSVVRLAAAPGFGWDFDRWEGPVEDPAAAETEVILDGDKTVTAVFMEHPLEMFTLTLNVQGGGAVEPPAGDYQHLLGAVIDLTAEPFAGWKFHRWEGPAADPGSPVTDVLIDGDITVTAIFVKVLGPDVGNEAIHMAGGVEFAMRRAPAGTFPTETNDSGEAFLDWDFWMAETPVMYELWYTVRQWAEQRDYKFSRLGGEGSHGNVGQAPTVHSRDPVTLVSWRDSMVWCNALSEMLGYQPVYTHQGSVIRDATDIAVCDAAFPEDTDGFRLPTSAEWELAARFKGTDSSHGALWRDGLYWTPGNCASGATAPTSDAAATQEVAWYNANAGGSTHEVGLLRANGLGLYDMTGNVWEWCFDWHPLYVGEERILRGGAWNSAAGSLLVGMAPSLAPFYFFEYIGFRLARTAF